MSRRIIKNLGLLGIYGYEVKGFVRTLESLRSYYEVSMDILNSENRKALFASPVYTKVRDQFPAVYGISAKVKNSLIADGCKIDGEVENCILFRGVTVAKGAKLKNCIIMQDSYIGDNSEIECVIADKQVVVKPNKKLCGASNYPVYIGKGIVRYIQRFQSSHLFNACDGSDVVISCVQSNQIIAMIS